MMNTTEKIIIDYREQKKLARNQALKRALSRPCTREEMFAKMNRVNNLYGQKSVCFPV